jgi:short-subunit dehydrogenase
MGLAAVWAPSSPRKEPRLKELSLRFPGFTGYVADFARAEGQERALNGLAAGDKVFYVAGGGPYGAFAEREWKDHQWALEVSFLFPARLLHTFLRHGAGAQFILVGSSVAESEGDPKAASYCAAKHALKGLYSTVRRDYPECDVRLFSPGYMDTELLPANAAVRQQGIYSPARIAQDLWAWSLASDIGGHKLYPKHPSC